MRITTLFYCIVCLVALCVVLNSFKNIAMWHCHEGIAIMIAIRTQLSSCSEMYSLHGSMQCKETDQRVTILYPFGFYDHEQEITLPGLWKEHMTKLIFLKDFLSTLHTGVLICSLTMIIYFNIILCMFIHLQKLFWYQSTCKVFSVSYEAIKVVRIQYRWFCFVGSNH